MKAILNDSNAATQLGSRLFMQNQPAFFKLKVDGLNGQSPLRVSFGGVVKRLKSNGTHELAFPPTAGAAVFMVRLETFQQGKEVDYQKGDVTLELLEFRLGEPVTSRGWLTWLAEKLGLVPKGGG